MLKGRTLKITPIVHPGGIIVVDIETEIERTERSKYYSGQFDPFSKIVISNIKVYDGGTVVFGTDVSYTEETPDNTKSITYEQEKNRRIFVVFITATSI